MTTRFLMIRDIGGYPTYALPQSDRKYKGLLVTGVAQDLVVPKDNRRYAAIFSYTPGDDVWVKFTPDGITVVPPVVPTLAIAPASEELNPVAREVLAGDTISFITSNASVEFGVILYAIQ